MRISRLQIGLLLATAALTSGLVFAGAESSGGLEHYDGRRGSAWFVKRTGEEKILACVSVAEGFGHSPQELADLTRWAFETWGNYIRQKRLSEAQVVTQVEVRGNCAGTEDLRMMFGVADAAVIAAQAQYVHPIAFPELQSYDGKRGWGRGFIWLAPNPTEGDPLWTDTDNLRGALLHEVGHILGNEHVSGTIMTGDLAREFSPGSSTMDSVRRARLTQIDHDLDLVSCHACEETLTSRSFSSSRAFRRLLGREAVGSPTVQFKTLPGAPKPVGTLTLTDGLGSFSFSVVPRIEVGTVSDLGVGVFKVADEYGTHGLDRGRQAYFGDLVLPAGGRLMVSVERNLSNSLEISVLEPTGSQPTFIFSAGRIQY